MRSFQRVFWLLAAVLCVASVAKANRSRLIICRSYAPYYSGVVIFDRWGACTLYSGIYLMYVSEQVKHELLLHKGKGIRISAGTEWQPMNPGDGLIQKFVYEGAPPIAPYSTANAGLQLKTYPDFRDQEKPVVVLEVANNGDKPLVILSSQLTLTLLMKREHKGLAGMSYDGPSVARITRQAFWRGHEKPYKGPRLKGMNETRWHGGMGRDGEPVWTIGQENALPYQWTLEPKQKRAIRITFNLSEGKYDFLGGYSGRVRDSESIASNLTAFDVTSDGRGKLVSVR